MFDAAMVLSVALLAHAVAPVERVAIDVEVRDGSGEREPVMEQQLRDKLADAFGARDVAAVSGQDQARGRVLVEVSRVDIIDYEVAVHIELDGAVVEPGVASFSCGPCRVVQLQDQVVERVPQMVEALEEPSPPTQVDDSQGPTATKVATRSPEQGSEVADQPHARRIGVVGISGIAVAALGLGASGYGVALAVRDVDPRPDADDDQFELRDSYARPARTWLGVGISAVVVGVSMVVVDLTVLRRQRERRVAVSPWAAPGLAGATAQVKF